MMSIAMEAYDNPTEELMPATKIPNNRLKKGRVERPKTSHGSSPIWQQNDHNFLTENPVDAAMQSHGQIYLHMRPPSSLLCDICNGDSPNVT